MAYIFFRIFFTSYNEVETIRKDVVMLIAPILLTAITIVIGACVQDVHQRELLLAAGVTVWITYAVTAIVDILGGTLGWWTI